MNVRIALELRTGTLEILLLLIRKKRCVVVDILGVRFSQKKSRTAEGLQKCRADIVSLFSFFS